MITLFEPYTVCFTLPVILVYSLWVVFIFGVCGVLYFVYWFIFKSQRGA